MNHDVFHALYRDVRSSVYRWTVMHPTGLEIDREEVWAYETWKDLVANEIEGYGDEALSEEQMKSLIGGQIWQDENGFWLWFPEYQG